MIPKLATDAIALSVVAGQQVQIAHGLGRQIEGWLVIYQTAPVAFHVQDPAADTRQTLILIPTASADVRLVLL